MYNSGGPSVAITNEMAPSYVRQEQEQIHQSAQSRTAPARLVERARIFRLAGEGAGVLHVA